MKSNARRARALKQLTGWAETQTTLWLIVEVEGAFDVFYTGCVQRLTDKDELFFLEPNEGGGVFQVSAPQCLCVARQAGRTGLAFSNDKGMCLKLVERLETDGCAGVTTPHDEEPR